MLMICLQFFVRLLSVVNPYRPIINVNPIILFYQSQYYGNVSLYLSKQLKKLCNQYFKDLKLIFAYRSIRMHDFFCFKNRVPECLRSWIVYKFSFLFSKSNMQRQMAISTYLYQGHFMAVPTFIFAYH